ncbi:MAG: DNA-directed RNA polymerase subunit beta' [Candidatus Geothermincolia bacterium]
MIDVNNFDALKIGLATADQIRSWSHGEVKKPETINYRTLKPEKDGLFCEKIFGPTKDWECYCGKYKRVRFKGIICERCGVEVTRAKVRRERMGHIELAAPVAHIWYFKGVPSRMGYLLDLTPKDLEKIIYFAASLVTSVDEDKRTKDLPMLEKELESDIVDIEKAAKQAVAAIRDKIENPEPEEEPEELEEGQLPKPPRKTVAQLEKEIKDREDGARKRADWLRHALEEFKTLERKQLVPDEQLFREMRDRYGEYFTGGMGAEAIQQLLVAMNLENEAVELRESIKTARGQKRTRSIKRLRVASSFIATGNAPSAMVLDVIPVIPPDLRPMVQLDGGRFATSDLNDLYRRVINRNNRLKRLLDLGAPEIIVNNEKRMLQEAVDALFDNGRRGRAVTGPGNRPLKSLSDMLKGKQGRFRQNLLGKRVDYSGRSVIVVGPDLKLHQCGLPKQMALELFKPFVMKRLVDMGAAQNIKSAKRMVERQKGVVWDVLEEVINEHPVMLNRAPTLHRLGIQAFEPILVEGKAIQIHPLVCTAFNADFDGDQMAVHLPLSAEAQAEARILMLSAHNVLSPAHGKPITTPTQDMVLGTNYLTLMKSGEKGTGRFFTGLEEARMAYEFKDIALHAPIQVRMREKGRPSKMVETTVGRLIFNEALPADYPYINEEITKKTLADIVTDCVTRYDALDTADILDNIKNVGFDFATRAGITIAVSDIALDIKKEKLLEKPERDVEQIERDFKRGLITEDERHQRVVEIWTQATDDVAQAMENAFETFNPVYMMAHSGARGNIKQIRQLAGMRGLVANPKGDIIDHPIKSNFREGLTVLEYFSSTHGARKGLADTALRTADSGYLTRRLVDVAQDIIIREDDCASEKGIPVKVLNHQGEPNRSLLGRVLPADVKNSRGDVVAAKGEIIDEVLAAKIMKTKHQEITVRSVLTCEARYGVCAACYGKSLASGKLVDIGEAVGIIAAQSIGEPGTQLTMRTFHTGGVAGEDITHGLPRVVELFEARKPKGQAIIADISGKIVIEDQDKVRKINIKDGDKEKSYQVPRRARLRVRDGQMVEAGDQIMEGSINPHDILRVMGNQAVQLYLVEEVQEVYKSQGVEIHDKHVELIVRQMMKKVNLLESGDTEMLPGQLVDRRHFDEVNEQALAESLEPAQGRQILLGITKASLATDSFLSAASFQETTRVLTDAAISGRIDPLLGLKENVIIGKLIPAGTGMGRYRNIKVRSTEAVDIFDIEAFAAKWAEESNYELDEELEWPEGSGETAGFEVRELGAEEPELGEEEG